MNIDDILSHPYIIGSMVAVIIFIFFWKAFLWLFGIIIVPDDSLGTVTKKFVIVRQPSQSPDGQIVALEGEAGYQADTLLAGPAHGSLAVAVHDRSDQVHRDPAGKDRLVDSLPTASRCRVDASSRATSTATLPGRARVPETAASAARRCR